MEQAYPATVERVFSEFADSAARAKWSAPLTETLVYDKADFREGGHDVFRCGPPNDLRFSGETSYHLIVPRKCVVSTETLSEGGRRLAIALNTMDFETVGAVAILRVTIRLVSFAGPGMAGGYESGNREALDGLSRHLAASGSDNERIG
jgi:uncharacterized protein YndB with AHSA1/START domain